MAREEHLPGADSSAPDHELGELRRLGVIASLRLSQSLRTWLTQPPIIIHHASILFSSITTHPSRYVARRVLVCRLLLLLSSFPRLRLLLSGALHLVVLSMCLHPLRVWLWRRTCGLREGCDALLSAPALAKVGSSARAEVPTAIMRQTLDRGATDQPRFHSTPAHPSTHLS